MAAILSRVVNTADAAVAGVARRRFRGASTSSAELRADVRGVPRPQARRARARLRRPAARAGRRSCTSPAAPTRADRSSTTCSSTSTRTPTRCRPISCASSPSGGATVTAVGDDAQAIYGFRTRRSATSSTSPNASARDVVVLDRNHRSTPAILAHHQRRHGGSSVEHKHDKALWSTRSRRAAARARVVFRRGRAVGGRVRADRSSSTNAASRCTTRRCCSAPRTTAICSSSSSPPRRIPYVKYGGLRFLEAAHVKDLAVRAAPRREPARRAGVVPRPAARSTASGRRRPAGSHGARRDAISEDDLPDAAAVAARARRRAAPRPRATGPGAAVERVRAWLDDRVERALPERVSALGRPRRSSARPRRSAPSLERFLDRADPRSAVSHRRPRRPAAPRRRLPHAVDDPLGEGRASGTCVHVLHVTDGNLPSDMATGDEAVDRRRAPAALRRHDAGA